MADEARFELAEACTSTVFKTVSLDRSDICPWAPKRRDESLVYNDPWNQASHVTNGPVNRS